MNDLFCFLFHIRMKCIPCPQILWGVNKIWRSHTCCARILLMPSQRRHAVSSGNGCSRTVTTMSMQSDQKYIWTHRIVDTEKPKICYAAIPAGFQASWSIEQNREHRTGSLDRVHHHATPHWWTGSLSTERPAPYQSLLWYVSPLDGRQCCWSSTFQRLTSNDTLCNPECRVRCPIQTVHCGTSVNVYESWTVFNSCRLLVMSGVVEIVFETAGHESETHRQLLQSDSIVLLRLLYYLRALLFWSGILLQVFCVEWFPLFDYRWCDMITCGSHFVECHPNRKASKDKNAELHAYMHW